MKKILAIIMRAMVAASMLPMMAFATEGDETKGASSASTSNCYINLYDTNNGELTDEQAELMEQFVDELEKQLSYDENGINTSDVDVESLKAKYGEDVVDMTYEGIETINEGVDEDLYEVTDNGTIYETEDDNMYVQGKYNKTSATTYVWGRLIKLSYSRANTQRKSLKSCNSVANTLGKVTTACSLFTKNTMFTCDAILSLGITEYTDYFCKRIKACNKKNIGIKYKIWWACFYRMRRQDASF